MSDFFADIQSEDTRLVTPEAQEVDRGFDVALRPKRLDEFLGQQKVKENLRIF
jgi:Holliday junction resolvasome RuvABC ATP-dependent DNA helicase subunit